MSNDIYGYSLDGETFHGRYATRAEAIAEGLRANNEQKYLTAGDNFTTGRYDVPPLAGEFVPDADDIMEHMAQKASDDYDAEDWPDIGKDDLVEARAQMEAALQNFAEAVQGVSPPTFSYVVDTQSHPVPEA